MRAARALVTLGAGETQHTRYFTVPTGAERRKAVDMTTRERRPDARRRTQHTGLGRPLEVPKCRLSKTIKSGRRAHRKKATVGAPRPGQDALVPPRVRLRVVPAGLSTLQNDYAARRRPQFGAPRAGRSGKGETDDRRLERGVARRDGGGPAPTYTTAAGGADGHWEFGR